MSTANYRYVTQEDAQSEMLHNRSRSDSADRVDYERSKPPQTSIEERINNNNLNQHVHGAGHQSRRKRLRDSSSNSSKMNEWIEIVSDELIVELPPQRHASSLATAINTHFTLTNIERALSFFSAPRYVEWQVKNQKREEGEHHGSSNAIAVFSTVEQAKYVLGCTNGYLRVGSQNCVTRFNDSKPYHRNQTNEISNNSNNSTSGGWNRSIDYELVSQKRRKHETESLETVIRQPQLFESNPSGYILDQKTGWYFDQVRKYYFDAGNDRYAHLSSFPHAKTDADVDRRIPHIWWTFEKIQRIWKPVLTEMETDTSSAVDSGSVQSTTTPPLFKTRNAEEIGIQDEISLHIHKSLKNTKKVSSSRAASAILFQKSTRTPPIRPGVDSSQLTSIGFVRTAAIVRSGTSSSSSSSSSSLSTKAMINTWNIRQKEDSNWNKIGCQYPLHVDFLYNDAPMTRCSDDGWLCLLCKRKFKDEEALSSHVHRSKLHKKNVEHVGELSNKTFQNNQANVHVLAKSHSSTTMGTFTMRPLSVLSSSAAPKAMYSSSSSMRRTKPPSRQHSTRRSNSSNGISNSSNSSMTTPPIVPAASTNIPLDIGTNIGAAMLKKMGWKVGDSLGLDSTSGMKEPLDAVRQMGGRVSGRGGKERLGLGHVHAQHKTEGTDLSDVLARQRAKKRGRKRGRKSG